MQYDTATAANGVADLHTEVLDNLRTMILEGELPPGSHIVERRLCQRLNISRTPLREAFKVLAAEGLIALLPNKGARVAEFREEDLREAFEVVATLEALAGRLAAAKATDDEIADIRAMHYQMNAHYLRRELEQYFELNKRIHAKIVELSGNSVLQAHVAVLSRRVAHARYAELFWNDELWEIGMREHEQILDLLVRREGDLLAQQLQDHLMNKLNNMIEGYRQKIQAAEKESAADDEKPAKPAGRKGNGRKSLSS